MTEEILERRLRHNQCVWWKYLWRNHLCHHVHRKVRERQQAVDHPIIELGPRRAQSRHTPHPEGSHHLRQVLQQRLVGEGGEQLRQTLFVAAT